MIARTDAHEVNALTGRASGPPQARNTGSFSPTSTRGVSGTL